MERGYKYEQSIIQGLPLELLIKILACNIAVSTPNNDGDEPFRVVVPPPPNSQYLILMQVCRRWRAAIINSPVFWVRYQLKATDKLNNGLPEHQASFDLTKEWVSRGGDCSKDLVVSDAWRETVTGVDPLSLSALPLVNEVLRTIARRLYKLHFLNLDVLGWNGLLLLPPASFPILKDFSIGYSNPPHPLGHIYAPQIAANPVFSNAPLHFICIEAGELLLKFDIADLGFTCTTLRTLRLCAENWQVSLKGLRDILEQCEYLETLEVGIDITLDNATLPGDLAGVTLSHCQDFSMSPKRFTPAYWQLGQLIELPALELFSIRCSRGIPQVPWQFAWYSRLLSPNISRLRTLILPEYSSPPIVPELIRLLRGATKLNRLEIGNCGPHVVDLLRHILTGALCPLLVDMWVMDKQIADETITALHELYLSPSRPSISLCDLYFIDRSGHHALFNLKRRVWKMLDELQKAGLGVRIFSSGLTTEGGGVWDEVNWA